MKIKQVAINEVIPYARNPRKNTDAITKVAASLKEYGWQQPIVVDKEMVVIAGHTRLEAARKLGMENVPVQIADNLTDAQVKAYRIADNRVSQEAEWDIDLLKIELGDLDDLDFDLLLTGFDDDELNAMLVEAVEEGLTDDDEVPAAPENPISVLGDIWQLGNHRLMCGDSTSVDAIEKLMAGNKADLIHTDPPYGINENCDRDFASRTRLAKGNKFNQIKGDENTEIAIGAFNVAQTLDIPKQVWWGANYYAHSIPETGNWIVWDKRVEDKQKDANSDCELAWVKSKWSSVRIFRHLWKGMIKESEHNQARIHPTQKPIALGEWVIDYFQDVKSVLDLFGGSGFNLIACEKKKIKCYMMELDETYVDVIIKRWQDFTGKEAVHAETGKTYNEMKAECDGGE